MCGIVGLFLKDEALQPDLGRLTGLMLRELCDRGPDSAGFAVYGAESRGFSGVIDLSDLINASPIAKSSAEATRFFDH